jgi:hypothetical protein
LWDAEQHDTDVRLYFPFSTYKSVLRRQRRDDVAQRVRL